MPDNRLVGEPDWTTFIYRRHHLGKHNEPASKAANDRQMLVLVATAVTVTLILGLLVIGLIGVT